MSNVRVKLNRSGVRDMLRSRAMKSICEEHARKLQQRCGAGYEVDSYEGTNRVNAMVYAATPEARRDALENNTLEKAQG